MDGKLNNGDIIACRSTQKGLSGWVARIIRKNYYYDHTAMYINDFIVESSFGIGVRSTPVREWLDERISKGWELDLYRPLKKPEMESLQVRIKESMGKPYDTFGVVVFQGLYLMMKRLFNKKKSILKLKSLGSGRDPKWIFWTDAHTRADDKFWCTEFNFYCLGIKEWYKAVPKDVTDPSLFRAIRVIFKPNKK